MAGLGDLYCNNSLPTRVRTQCKEYKQATQRNVVIFNQQATTTDPTNSTTINADIANGDAFKLLDVMIEIPVGEAVTITDPVDGSTTTIGRKYVSNWTDYNVELGNDTFYTSLNDNFIGTSMLIENGAVDDFNTWITNTKSGIGFDVGLNEPLADSEVIQYTGTFNYQFNSGNDIQLVAKVSNVFV